ncbi:MAG: radical SAM protein [Clostridia bacterium]
MEYNIEEYLSKSVARLTGQIAKAAVKNPKTGLFMARYARRSASAAQKRKEAEERGEHIPAFLIAGITTSCNLHCKGCYARANHSCTDTGAAKNALLSPSDWNRVFDEAEELGIAFILLAGGEPLMRPEILAAAGSHQKLLFPVFTNGTLFTEENITLLEKNPNLLPILSIEGNRHSTDTRRGDGVYRRLTEAMETLKKKSLLFGASITVQKNNLAEVLSEDFVKDLSQKGCGAVIYVEYVPADKGTEAMAPDETDRKAMTQSLATLREKFPEMIFLSFPGDEEAMGGCLASGRGFFHINAFGAAEPCPFSPFSDCSLKDHSLKEALNSPLFIKLRNSSMQEIPHTGGCALFSKEEEIKAMLEGNS